MTNCKLVVLLFVCPLFSAIVFDFNLYIYDHYLEPNPYSRHGELWSITFSFYFIVVAAAGKRICLCVNFLRNLAFV
jgi:hypothetical protein